MTITLQNARVFSAGGFVPADLSFSVSDPAFESSGCAVSVLDGLHVFPGFADVHVHLREPGFSYKETIASGTRAAAHGGYTAVCSMPNLSPVPDSAEHLEAQLSLIRRGAVIPVHPYGAITVGEEGGSLSAMEELAPSVIAFSDDGRGVQSESVMREAMKKAKALGKVIAAHCEVNALLDGGVIHDGEYARAHGHPGISSESEWRMIERDLGLARETGCAYHVCHVSTKESVSLIRQAKREGLDVTCETAPHYLILDESRLEEDGRFKMNPPLRSREDRLALIEGLLDGTIDIIATDHAPHSAAEKSRGLEKSAMGVVGLECAFPLLYTYLVRPGILTMTRLMELLHYAPCRRFGISSEMPENFTVFDLGAAYEIDPNAFLSLGRSTPFAGMRVYGRCVATVVNGRAAYFDLG